ncbi:MAG: DUF4105 domain-containing protein [Akkermansiaceae bacterium]|nr:DUF4105 domain-containing protein [Akkermansiaceae bacterium]
MTDRAQAPGEQASLQTNPHARLGQWLAAIKSWPWKKSSRLAGRALVFTLAVIVALYLWGMVFYNGPFSQAGAANFLLASLWLLLSLALYRRVIGVKNKLLAVSTAVGLVIIPYSRIQPSNDRPWSPEFARTGYTGIAGDLVYMHNMRNFDYTEAGEVSPRWETRTVHLSNLRGLDLFHDTFMGDLMGHPILSFDFGPDGRVCLSVETRRETGETFTPFGGLYKLFELQYLFATEEDCIRLRTNVRKEPVYLYQIDAPLEEIREMFLTSVDIQNELAETPRFYNVISANCTTSLRAQRPKGKRGAWDHRILFNGLLDEWLYERGRLKTHGLSFAELRQRCLINEAAGKAHDSRDFSKAIRQPLSRSD